MQDIPADSPEGIGWKSRIQGEILRNGQGIKKAEVLVNEPQTKVAGLPGSQLAHRDPLPVHGNGAGFGLVNPCEALDQC